MYNHIQLWRGVEIINTLNVKTFLVIVEENSLARAAEKLFLSQSTVSYRLNELEEEIGTKLIYREQGKRTITLTSEGEDFIPLAERWISLDQETNQWKNKEISELNLNIGSVDSLNTYLFHTLYKKIIQGDNPLTLNVNAHWTFTVYNLLKSYEVDVGLILGYINFNNIITEPIFRERMVLASGNETTNYDDTIRPSDLDPTKEIHINFGSNLDQWRDYWFGRPLKSKFLVTDTAGLLSRFLTDSEYWALVPISVARNFEKGMDIKIFELEGDVPNRVCYKAKHKSPKLNTVKPIKIFEEYLYDFIEQNPDLETI